MVALVADVGGSNTRIALSDGSVLMQQARFANDDFSGFDAVLSAYVKAHDLPELAGMHVAIAGPVRPDDARLTNRHWAFDRAAIGQIVGLPKARVHLFNDLAALGHSLQVLGATQASPLRMGQGQGNGQALVIGMGTGVNVCLVKRTELGAVVVEAEQGHTVLSCNITQALGDFAPHFPSTEDLFAGRGLSKLDGLITGRKGRQGAAVVQADDPASAVALMAHCLGLYTRQLVFQYMPLDGIYFAGSVARGVLGTDKRSDLLAAFEADGPFQDMVSGVPISVITDDGAALYGLAQMLKQSGPKGMS